jgi:guanylate kinase
MSTTVVHPFAEEINGKPIVIITAPSGAGKTSITRYLLEKYPRLKFSVSAATRTARSNEQDGKDYYFMSSEEFQQKIIHEEFVEWEMVYEGKYYGTLKQELIRIWNNNQIPVLDIDVKGAIHVQQQNPEGSLSIFIEPPSIPELQHRLLARGTESAKSLEARINKAAFELSFKHSFTHCILNADLELAKKEAEQIIVPFMAAHQNIPPVLQ